MCPFWLNPDCTAFLFCVVLGKAWFLGAFSPFDSGDGNNAEEYILELNDNTSVKPLAHT